MTAKPGQQFDFYILQSTEQLRFTCRLLYKAYHQGYKAIVFCPNDATAQEFDRMLWTFKDISFIPHQITTTTNEFEQTPISIWQDTLEAINVELSDYFDLTIILTPELSPDKINCARVACVVPNQEDWKQTARNYFKLLKQHTDDVQVHKMNE